MSIYKKALLMLLVMITVAAGTTLYEYNQYEGDELKTSELTATASPEVSKNEIMVYVSGAVNNSGVVTVPEGARIADAVEKCGGVLPTADLEKVNMAQLLKDGAQIRIPEKNDLSGSSAGKQGGRDFGGSQENMVNINQADAKALEALPGIGPAMSQRIVEYRNANGNFQSVEELQKVKGIGKAKFEKLKDRVTV